VKLLSLDVGGTSDVILRSHGNCGAISGGEISHHQEDPPKIIHLSPGESHHLQSELFVSFFVPIFLSLGCLPYDKNANTLLSVLSYQRLTGYQVVMGLSTANSSWDEATAAAD